MSDLFMIQIIELASGDGSELEGMFVKSYDPEAHEGRGDVVGTLKPSEALKLSSADAMALYRKQAGLRDDGKPNRPLTAFTVEFVRVDEHVP